MILHCYLIHYICIISTAVTVNSIVLLNEWVKTNKLLILLYFRRSKLVPQTKSLGFSQKDIHTWMSLLTRGPIQQVVKP